MGTAALKGKPFGGLQSEDRGSLRTTFSRVGKEFKELVRKYLGFVKRLSLRRFKLESEGIMKKPKSIQLISAEELQKKYKVPIRHEGMTVYKGTGLKITSVFITTYKVAKSYLEKLLKVGKFFKDRLVGKFKALLLKIRNLLS